MNKFEFGENKAKMLTIEVCGRKYTFNPFNLATKKAVEKFVKCQKVLIDRFSKKELTDEELNKISLEACSLVREAVNNIIGKKSYEKIFQNRTINFEENMSFINFLFETITDFTKNEHINKQTS